MAPPRERHDTRDTTRDTHDTGDRRPPESNRPESSRPIDAGVRPPDATSAETAAARSDARLHFRAPDGPPAPPPPPPNPAEVAAGRSDTRLHEQNRTAAPVPASFERPPVSPPPPAGPHPVLMADHNGSGVVVDSDRADRFRARENMLANLPPDNVFAMMFSAGLRAAGEVLGASSPEQQRVLDRMGRAIGDAVQSTGELPHGRGGTAAREAEPVRDNHIGGSGRVADSTGPLTGYRMTYVAEGRYDECAAIVSAVIRNVHDAREGVSSRLHTPASVQAEHGSVRRPAEGSNPNVATPRLAADYIGRATGRSVERTTFNAMINTPGEYLVFLNNHHVLYGQVSERHAPGPVEGRGQGLPARFIDAQFGRGWSAPSGQHAWQKLLGAHADSPARPHPLLGPGTGRSFVFYRLGDQ